MLYLIHKHTKEHRRYNDALDWPDSDCMVVGGDPDGWIEWQGGECPLPDGAECQYRMRDGDEDAARVFALRWTRWGDDSDIIAYRPILDQQAALAGAKLWQDAEGTIPCRDGDPVGRVDCGETGNAWHASGDSRPVYRERTEPPAWDGEGLPPVGCECEAYFMHGATTRWRKAEVLKHGTRECAVFIPDLNALGWCNTFRPIRSEQDRAVEEMLSLDQYPKGESAGGMLSRADFCRALYRAGYRKTGGE